MKRTILYVVLSIYVNLLQAQVLLNGPEAVVAFAQGQFASIALPVGVTVNWIIAGGTITSGATQPIVFFNAAASASIVLTAQLSNNTQVQKTIPINPAGANLFQGATVTFSAGVRQYPILQLLRGERFVISTQISAGVAPLLTLLDFQGRFLTQGQTIDFRAPVRGSYYIVLNAQVSGTLIIQGIRQPESGATSSASTAISLPNAIPATTEFTLNRSSVLTGGEAMVKSGSAIIVAVYDFNINKTRITSYVNDAQSWAWLSDEQEYIRTLNTNATGNILAVGSAGGADPASDQVVMIRLNANGTLAARVTFGTSGTDYGYGIAALADNSVIVSGFTNGAFAGFVNAGGLDVFAVKVSSAHVVLQTLQFGSNRDDRVFAAKTLLSGNVLLFGDTEGDLGDNTNPLGEFDVFLASLTPSLARSWTEHYGSSENDLAFDIVIDPASGDAFLTGMTTGVVATGAGNPQSPNVFTMRISPSTNAIVWARQLGPNEGQSGETLALSSSGVGVLFYTNGSFPGASNNSLGSRASDDMVVAHYDWNGNLTWLYQFDKTSERIFARAIAFQGTQCYVLQDHAYVPGDPFVTTSLDRFTVPVSTSVGVFVEEERDRQRVYPNPTTGLLYIQNDSRAPLKQAMLMDTDGRLINVQAIPAGVSLFQFDVAMYKKGLYVLQLQMGTDFIAHRVVIQ